MQSRYSVMIQVVSNNVSNISSISGVSDGDGVVISIVVGSRFDSNSIQLAVYICAVAVGCRFP